VLFSHCQFSKLQDELLLYPFGLFPLRNCSWFLGYHFDFCCVKSVKTTNETKIMNTVIYHNVTVGNLDFKLILKFSLKELMKAQQQKRKIWAKI